MSPPEYELELGHSIGVEFLYGDPKNNFQKDIIFKEINCCKRGSGRCEKVKEDACFEVTKDKNGWKNGFHQFRYLKTKPVFKPDIEAASKIPCIFFNPMYFLFNYHDNMSTCYGKGNKPWRINHI